MSRRGEPTSSKTAAPSASVPQPHFVLQATGIHRAFRMGDSTVQVLRGVDLSVRQGEFIAIEGRSGSGKSTLLHILGALDSCDSGVVLFGGRDLAKLPQSERALIRNRDFGFVFQFYHLLPELNVLENTMLAAMVKHGWLSFRASKKQLVERAEHVLAEFGLSHRLKHRPNQLSGGERQRVAIARALMNEPTVLFADEPTGNLDNQTGRQIMSVLESLHRDRRQTIVMVTHDRSLASRCDRALLLQDGVLVPAPRNS
jgi:lipoprotein-releasing system ATP-binding protein